MVKELAEKGFSIELIDFSPPDTRPKSYYYRPCGMQVGPWPCDKKSQKYYLNKGYLLEPPESKPKTKTYPCPICGKKFDNLGGLIDCLEIHKKEET